MEAALASLDRGVRAIFTAPSGVVTASPTHPLCECILWRSPPPGWRYTLRYPVLKRHVLTQFRSVAVEMAKKPLTPRKRKKRSIVQQRGDVGEYKSLCLASLCQKLAQCELLTVSEAELVMDVVNLETLDVLQRVITGKLLPLRLRMLLLGFTLQSQEEKCLEVSVQTWIQEVCEKLLEETLEATATGGTVSEPPTKRARTRAGDNRVIGGEGVGKCCGFCRDGVSVESLRSDCGGWDFLVERTQRIARILETAGESYATNHAMVALSAFWDSLPVAGSKASGKTGRRRKRSEISVKCEENAELSMAVEAYEKCCKVAIEGWRSASGELGSKAAAFEQMWMCVWEREWKSLMKMKSISLVDAIRHCSKADTFGSTMLPPDVKGKVSNFPGFRVIMEVIRSLFLGVSGVITAFAQVWGTAGTVCTGGFSRFTVPMSAGMSSTRRVLRSYLSEILTPSKVRQGVMPSYTDKAPTSSSLSLLDLLFVLYEIFPDTTAPRDLNVDNYARYWDVLMTQSNGEASTNESSQDGVNWCLILERCLLTVDDKAPVALRHGGNFSQTLQSYCLAIMYGILTTSGEVISSGGTIRRQLICVESDRAVVRRVLAQMMITFGEEWVSALVVELLRKNTQLLLREERSQRAVKTYLFPALVSYMKFNSRVGQMRQKTGQQQYVDIIHAVNAILKEKEPTPLYLVSLMRFCEAWDAYQRTHTKEPPVQANRWGFRAMIDLDMLPELVDCYERDAVVRQEASEALMFAADVLQNASSCPVTLEGRLCKVLSDVKAGAEHIKSSSWSLLEAGDKQLISHSGDVLQRLLRAVRFADLNQTHHLVSQIKDTGGTLSELRQQLERWFSFVEMHGAAFAGKESRMELSLLCTRLMRWFPNEFESMRFVLMTPLDSHFVFALKTFVKEAGRTTNTDRHSLFSSTARSALPSAVRVEMALHLYLSAAAFPDVETLTVLLTKALVKCRSPDSFVQLTRVVQKNVRILLPEAVVATLRSPLRGLEFSGLSSVNRDAENDDDAEMRDYTRRAKSIIYQENALKLLSMSVTIFDEGISWSTLLFDKQSAVIWLPHFFEYVLKTEFCEGSFRADLLLTSLEELTQATAGPDEKTLKESFWLAAVINTALVSCSSRSAGAFADGGDETYNRLRVITGKVLQLIPPPPPAHMDCSRGDDAVHSDGILGLVRISKCARLIIEENGSSWSRERFIDEKTASILRKNVSNAWGKPQEEPSLQLFIPFSQWLSGALVYSQAFLEEPSATMRRWERTFTSYVTDLYLPLEFEGHSCNLLKSWLTTWVTSNIARGQDDRQLLALLPSQVALFRRLGLTPYRDPSSDVQDRGSTSIWRLVCVAINLAVNHHTPENSTSIEQATELVVSTLTTLELVELSAASDFVQFRHVQEIEPFLEELTQFLSQPQLRHCNATQVCCLLQYPLELLVCCYACKIPADFETESEQFLQQVKQVLRKSLTTVLAVDNGDERPDSLVNSMMESTEVDEFFQYWADEMMLKYDYLDRERCANILEITRAALQGGAGGVQ